VSRGARKDTRLHRIPYTENLAASGIRGDSVEPNVEAWPMWKEASADVRRVFRRQIDKWKEGLL
jgi:hypothetical protein